MYWRSGFGEHGGLILTTAHRIVLRIRHGWLAWLAWLGWFGFWAQAIPPLVVDDFSDVHGPGEVVDTRSTSGTPRLVTDIDERLSIDGDSLRMGSTSTNLWGIGGVSYGPFSVVPGLTMAARIRLGDTRSWPTGDTSKLAVGWFFDESTANPASDSLALVLRRMPGLNQGALYASTLDSRVPVLESVMPVDLQLFAVCRSESVMLYVSSVRGVKGSAAYPAMRPIAILPLEPAKVYAGIQQRAQKEGSATWVDGFRVAVVPEWTDWSGTAAWSDSFGAGSMKLSAPSTNTPPATEAPELVGTWTRSTSLLPRPAGFVTARVESEGLPGRIAFIFRAVDGFNHWRLELDGTSARMIRVVQARESVVLENRKVALKSGVSHRFWITDDGSTIRVWRDQESVMALVDSTFADGLQVGFAVASGAGLRLHHFEAHLREIPIVAGLRMGAPFQRRGAQLVLKDSLVTATNSLVGRKISPTAVWRRHGGPEPDRLLLGNTLLEKNGTENAGMVSYLLPWSYPDFADVSVEVVPPRSPAEGHAGVAIWQDDQNLLWYGFDTPMNRYVLWCVRDGRWIPVEVEVSSIPLGAAHRMRLCSDGVQFSLWRDDEVLIVGRIRDYFQGTSPLKIAKVGIGLGRYEKKGDQGTMFRDFEARWSTESVPANPAPAEWKRPDSARRGPVISPTTPVETKNESGEFGDPVQEEPPRAKPKSEPAEKRPRARPALPRI